MVQIEAENSGAGQVSDFFDCYAGDPVRFVRDMFAETPDPWQADVLREIAKGTRRIAVRSGHGVGKAQFTGSYLPTPDGMRRYGDLVEGDRVFAEDGTPTHVTGVFEQGVRPAFRLVFDDGTGVIADAEHLWKVRGRHERRNGIEGWRVLTTAQIIEAGVKRRNGKGSRCNQWEIPRQGAPDFEGPAPCIRPYALGVWLGNGTRRSSKITEYDAEVIAHLRETGETVKKQQTRGQWAIVGLHTKLRCAGLAELGSPDRFIPDICKYVRAEDRAELLRGLMDTDGETMRHGTSLFSSTSKRLAEDVAWLIRSLGGKAHLWPKAKRGLYRAPDGDMVECRDCYRVTVRMPADFLLFYVKRKEERRKPCEARYLSRWIERIEPAGECEMRCITVAHPSHCFLFNDFVVTHNSTCASWAMIWYLLTRLPVKIVVTSQSAGQLWDALFAELKTWISRLPPEYRALLKVGSDRVEFSGAPDEGFISARTSRPENPEALAGIHARNVMIVADEASGIPEPIFEAAYGSMTGERAVTILLGNPIRTSGFFYDVFHKLADRWYTLRVSCLDSKRAQPEYAADIAARYGEDSNVYRVRVLGEFPKADDDTVIPLELVEAAARRDVDASPTAPVLWGLDVARFGDDSTALVKRKANIVPEKPKVWRSLDLMRTAGIVAAEFETTPAGDRPVEILVDAIGVGAGVADRLRELKLPARGVNVSELPAIGGTYINLRAELWFKAKAWFAKQDCRIPADDRLVNELAVVRYAFQESSGKMKIEPKDEMKRRGLASPDVADAFCLTFASEAGTALYGTSYASDWARPIRRNLVSV